MACRQAQPERDSLVNPKKAAARGVAKRNFIRLNLYFFVQQTLQLVDLILIGHQMHMPEFPHRPSPPAREALASRGVLKRVFAKQITMVRDHNINVQDVRPAGSRWGVIDRDEVPNHSRFGEVADDRVAKKFVKTF